MEEILLAKGFTAKGFCSVCSGQAKEYQKLVGNRLVKVKVYGRMMHKPTGQEWVERGDAMIVIGGSKTKVGKTEWLTSTLEFMKLV
tara:strand:+ start:3532 stop:3789 length:258 start_codon:yes stop_codon:yes gene_type:complete